MTRTGWIGGEDEGPAMPMTARLLDRQEHRASPLEVALARSAADDARALREEAAFAPDPDERAAGFVARGYMPGMLSQLTMRLADTEAELAAEEDKLERSARRQERIHRDHAAGKITAFDIARMQAADIDEGDTAVVERLSKRAAGLRQQIGEASALMSPQRERERELDAVAEAGRRAHQLYVETTRARLAEAQAGRPVVVRPLESVSRGADVPAEVTCPACQAIGASPEESFELHHSDVDGRLLAAAPEDAELPEPAGGEAGRGENWPLTYDGLGREITRAVGYNDNGVYGNHPVAYR
jgi:hypothetical protein